jgi:hypothetical protein
MRKHETLLRENSHKIRVWLMGKVHRKVNKNKFYLLLGLNTKDGVNSY